MWKKITKIAKAIWDDPVGKEILTLGFNAFRKWVIKKYFK